ncbi:MAG: DinB family protein [Cyclobacteriaceae bacterium]|nr:DinB family protein [Cyclobacteriaceae bacterium]
MHAIDQGIFLEQLEREGEEQLKEVIAVFQNLPEDILIRPARNGGWSIADCIVHLNSYALFYLPRLERAFAAAPPIDNGPFKHTVIGHYFITMMDVDRSKRKYKAMKLHRPQHVNEPYRAIADFILNLERMLILLATARTKRLRSVRIGTSISLWIKINAGDALAFLMVHNKRHLVQAKQNLQP